MEGVRGPIRSPDIGESILKPSVRRNTEGNGNHGPALRGLKKRGLGSRSWIKIDEKGNSKVLELDKATIMKHCSLPARDLRLLDPLFIYPSTVLGREKAIVVSLEQLRCIIMADEAILMNSLDGCVVQYHSELCKRLQTDKDQADDLPFEFRALELALEITCMSLDGQVKELEMEMCPVLDELASAISTLNLERVRRFKGQLLALTQRVQKVRDEIEQLMEDDGDMAEMHLTEKKLRAEAYCLEPDSAGGAGMDSNSAPVSPVLSITGSHKLQRNFSTFVSSSRQGSFYGSSTGGEENIEQLEMLLEAYFEYIDHTLSKLSSLKEYIDDTEDFINIKLGNVQNQLIQFELLLAAATFVATIFAVVAGIFGMNFEEASIFDHSSTFHWVLILSGIVCGFLYFSFLLYFRFKKVFPL